jgi:hypothetical protein
MKSSSGAIKIQLHKVSIDRGMSWDQAFSCFSKSLKENRVDRNEGGFYVNSSVCLKFSLNDEKFLTNSFISYRTI